MLDLLRAGFFTADFHDLLCPALNPSGLAAATRENAFAVDLNCSYWLRGTPEVVAHAGWLDALDTPEIFIFLHED